MPLEGSNALQKAMFNALKAIEGLGAEVYDFVPQNATYPYCRIGLDTLTEFDTKSDTGRECEITIHIWAKHAGGLLTKQIMDRIYQALHRNEAALSIVGFGVIQLICAFSTIIVESGYENGERYQHGVMRFNALIEED